MVCVLHMHFIKAQNQPHVRVRRTSAEQMRIPLEKRPVGLSDFGKVVRHLNKRAVSGKRDRFGRRKLSQVTALRPLIRENARTDSARSRVLVRNHQVEGIPGGQRSGEELILEKNQIRAARPQPYVFSVPATAQRVTETCHITPVRDDEKALRHLVCGLSEFRVPPRDCPGPEFLRISPPA
ncbi:MAG: hypothetical protein BWY06_03517 [Candidatus Latescibacteria bacterium ADurb.Bin168]|nr:MAG: hypothetical protein BWY06_03517 [Candidatus Latescibacteria bacterium ADurb.Bin168]